MAKSNNKSGVSPQVLSLPKGGGAIRGLGEKFQPDLHTGTGNFSIPLDLPPARNDFAPKLALSYSTGAGNGPFGLGWSVGISSVTRKTSSGIPIYDDDQDTFILAGAEDLVETARSGTTIYYRPRTEGLFARISHVVDVGQNYWLLETKDGIKHFYGESQDCQIFDPLGKALIFAWYLARSEDTFGNKILYHYKRDNGPIAGDQGHAYNQIYPKRIEYCNYINQNTNTEAFLFQVDFDYGEYDPSEAKTQEWELRPDRFSSYRAGFEIRTARRCKRILIRSLAPTANAPTHLIRSYDLLFAQDALTNISMLKQVVHRGYSDTKYHVEPEDQNWDFDKQKPIPADQNKHRQTNLYAISFPPVGLSYSTFDPARQQIRALSFECERPPEKSLRDPNYELIDLYGNGLPDIIHTAPNLHIVWRNLGNGRFAPPRPMQFAPAGVTLTDDGIQFADMNGNGSVDLLITEGSRRGFYENNFSGQWGRFHAYTQSPSFSLRDPNVRLVDIDGDGVTDVLATFEHHFLYIRNTSINGHLEFGTPIPITRQSNLEMWPNVYFDQPENRVRLADMSGDGLQDTVLVFDGRVDYWPNLGHGKWGSRLTLSNGPHLPGRYDPKRLFLSDINGDGLADLVYIGADRVHYWINQSGNSWSEEQIIACTPPVTDADSVRIADINGTGTGGILWSYDWTPSQRNNFLYLDFTGGEKPLLLTGIDNHIGAMIHTTYRPSTEFYVEDESAGHYWKTTLPFPVNVVSKVVTEDLTTGNKLTTRYAYHHGYYDGREREFRGFGQVDHYDAEFIAPDAYDVPPTLTKTWFHTGAFFEEKEHLDLFRHHYYQGDTAEWNASSNVDTGDSPLEAYRCLAGAIMRTEVYGLDGSDVETHPYSVTETGYQVKLIQPKGSGTHAIFFRTTLETLSYHYERNPNDPRISHEMTLEVDDFGNITKSASVGYPRRQNQLYDEQNTALITYTESDFINNPASPAYHVGIPYGLRTYQIHGPVQPQVGRLIGVNLLNQIRAANEIQYEVLPNNAAVQKRLIEQSRTYYYRNNLGGRLPLGQIGLRVLVYQTHQQAFTAGLVQAIYGNRVNNQLLTVDGRYILDQGVWWLPSGREEFDANHYYMPVRYIDPFGATYQTTYDRYSLLTVETRDPLHNITSVRNSYRVMQPELLKDANDSRTKIKLNALGLVTAVALMGRRGRKEGDTIADPTSCIKYHLWEWLQHGQPIFVHTETREQHRDPNTRWQHAYSYSDGFGREIQKKIQAEPGPLPTGEIAKPRWVGSGWTIFNNKGKPVRKYEPFFTDTHDFENNHRVGVSPMLFYDPLERVIATLHPNHTYEKVVFDAWQQTTYDVNDTVTHDPSTDDDVKGFVLDAKGNPRLPQQDYLPTWYDQRQGGVLGMAEQDAATKAAKHADTPTVTHFDTMGRPFLTVVHNGFSANGNPIEYRTLTKLDIEGNQRQVIDAKDRIVMQYDYDMLGNSIHQASMEAGGRWIMNDVTSNPIRTWDSRGFERQMQYDVLRRPTHLFVIENGIRRLAEHIVYGETQGGANNHRTRIYQVFDAAGVVTNEVYDFKGNLKHSRRELLSNYKQAVDWSQNPIPNYGAYVTSTEYDALNRPIQLTNPDGSIYRPTFKEANLLDKVEVTLPGLQPALFVENIDYNAKGQRTLIKYGNGVVTTYEYDNDTFRLIHLLTQRNAANFPADCANPPPVGWPGCEVQNLHYTYDPVGNIMHIQDDARQIIYFKNKRIEPSNGYTYDALYRLIEARGREHLGQVGGSPIPHSYNDVPRVGLQHPGDGNAMGTYIEHYVYDEVGNFLSMKHVGSDPEHPGWTRSYVYNENSLIEMGKQSNRLSSTTIGNGIPEVYPYDEHGNMLSMNHLQIMQWDFEDQLQMTQRQAVNVADADGVQHQGERTWYVYDATGQRVRKVTENQNGHPVKERIYLGGCEIYREFNGNGANIILKRESLHVMDDKQLIALVETQTLPNQGQPLIRYQLGNHLGSASIELDENAAVITYEEYYPYGTTSFQAGRSILEVKQKRYRYTSKERDDESGLYYHGARYYAPWLGRWTSCDSLQNADGLNLYSYVRNNPIRFNDPKGHQGNDPNQASATQPSNPIELRLPTAVPKFEVSQMTPNAELPLTQHPMDYGSIKSFPFGFEIPQYIAKNSTHPELALSQGTLLSFNSEKNRYVEIGYFHNRKVHPVERPLESSIGQEILETIVTLGASTLIKAARRGVELIKGTRTLKNSVQVSEDFLALEKLKIEKQEAHTFWGHSVHKRLGKSLEQNIKNNRRIERLIKTDDYHPSLFNEKYSDPRMASRIADVAKAQIDKLEGLNKGGYRIKLDMLEEVGWANLKSTQIIEIRIDTKWSWHYYPSN